MGFLVPECTHRVHFTEQPFGSFLWRRCYSWPGHIFLHGCLVCTPSSPVVSDHAVVSPCQKGTDTDLNVRLKASFEFRKSFTEG